MSTPLPTGYALITGASTGIGLALARRFAKAGIPLLLTASSRSCELMPPLCQELSAEYGVPVLQHCLNLGEAGAAQALADWVQAQGIAIEYLVNNAGFGLCDEHYQDHDPQRLEQMLALNMLAPSLLIRHFLPPMLAQGRGRILNVSSIAGYIYPHHKQGAYAATKAYMVSLSESLSQDLMGTPITCTHLAPGPVQTPFFANAGLDKARPLAMPPEAVAAAGFAAMMAGRRRIIPGWGNKLAALGARISPSRRLVGAIAQRFLAD